MGGGFRILGWVLGVIGVDPNAVVERTALDDTSWVDVSRRWLLGADDLFDHLLHTVEWRTTKLFRYDQVVEERRLSAGWERDRRRPLPHPALADITRALQRTYRVEFPGFSMIQYRDGSDGQGFHRDTDMRWLDDTIIAVLTLGAQRPWLLRPRMNRFTNELSGPAPSGVHQGATHDLAPSSGDLLVLGGRSQADWEHSVAYRKGRHDAAVGIRISLQWRAARKVGEPFRGPSFRASVGYGHGKAAPAD